MTESIPEKRPPEALIAEEESSAAEVVLYYRVESGSIDVDELEEKGIDLIPVPSKKPKMADARSQGFKSVDVFLEEPVGIGRSALEDGMDRVEKSKDRAKEIKKRKRSPEKELAVRKRHGEMWWTSIKRWWSNR